jgi:trimeric autotransporter adhesin
VVGASSACSGGTTGNLADITVNGGQCFAVPDPNDLPNIIPNLIGSTLTSLTMSVDGGPQTPVATTPALPRPGPAAVTYSTMTAGLSPGSHVICVTGNATDPHSARFRRRRSSGRQSLMTEGRPATSGPPLGVPSP